MRQSTKNDIRFPITAILLGWVLDVVPKTPKGLELVDLIGKWCKEQL